MIDIFKSDDLINWTRTENTLPEVPECVTEKYPHNKKSDYSNIWAPDMYYNEDDEETPYYLTCSYSDQFGNNNSSIILFKASSPEGPWENGEIIFSSSADDPVTSTVNAIDSNIVVDAATGDKYMSYGSFWQGIHLLKLDDSFKVTDKDTGKCIESRFSGIGGPEGSYIIYNPDTKYYYLFTSYDDLSSTYTIRVARSKTITGPYADYNGSSVNRFADNPENQNNIYGYKLMGSYQFPDETTYYAPGHNSVLNDDGEWYLVHHCRVTNGGYATLHVRKMLWTEDGWPIVSPERYSGERVQDIDAQSVVGAWNYMDIGRNTKDMVFSQELELYEDGNAALGKEIGEWSISGNKLVITLGESKVTAYVLPSYDRDTQSPRLVFTGTDEKGTEIWGKKADAKLILEN
jgi:arabinan endo-1,5-alpha-L-arabinosidase